MKKQQFLLALLLLVVACSKSGSGTQKTQSEPPQEQEISIWFISDELETNGIIKDFNQKYPDIKVNNIIVPNEEYVSKLRTVLRSKKNVPDIFVGEAANVQEWVDTDFWDDLPSYPGAEKIANITPYVRDVGTDRNGIVKALAWQANPGGVYYRRSIMEKFFGVSAPEDISPYFKDMETMLQTAAQLKEKSGGEYMLFASPTDLFQIFFGGKTKNWVSADKRLDIDEDATLLLEAARQIRQNGYDAKVTHWTPAWYNTMKQEGKVAAFYLPPWGLSYLLKLQAPETSGDWGVVAPPKSFFWGGTWLGIYKDSPNKDAAWKFIEMVTLDTQYSVDFSKRTGGFSANVPAAQQIVAEGYRDPFLKDQDTYAFYQEELPKITGKFLTKYDLDIGNIVQSYMETYANDVEVSLEAILKEIKERIQNLHPDLSIE
ncbi:MAG: extracellular solute-binding protein [Spirochaetota bacterium]